MLPLKTQEAGEDFQISIFKVRFQTFLVQIYLMIFLKVLEARGVEGEGNRLTIEDQI